MIAHALFRGAALAFHASDQQPSHSRCRNEAASGRGGLTGH